MKKSEFKDCDVYAERIARLRPFPKETLKSLRDYCRAEYIATLEKAGRAPADFVRFVRDRVCETQKELLRLMGESIQLDEGINEGVNEGVNQLLSVVVANPGLRANALAMLVGKSVQTVERYIRVLKVAEKIEFRGAPKTGGYFSLETPLGSRKDAEARMATRFLDIDGRMITESMI